MPKYPKKKLERSVKNRKVAGVCGGLGAYFNVDPVIFRIVFLIFVLPGGVPGVLLYLLSWLLMPANSSQRYSAQHYPKHTDSTGKDYTDTYDI